MSVRIMNWAWHDPATQHLRGNAAMALLALADIADDEGHVVYAKGAKRSQESLAKKARMSVATFRRVTADLVEQGFLEVSRESPRSENEYRVIVTAQSERSPVSGQTVADERSHRSPVSGHPSYRRNDVSDVDTSDVASDDLPSKWSEEVRRLCTLLAEAVMANGHRVGVVGEKWWAACDRLIRIDGYTPGQIEWMIRWATADEFWAANIRSMPTLRDKFSTMKLQAQRQAAKQRQEPAARAYDVVDLGRRMQEQAAGSPRPELAS